MREVKLTYTYTFQDRDCRVEFVVQQEDDKILFKQDFEDCGGVLEVCVMTSNGALLLMKAKAMQVLGYCGGIVDVELVFKVDGEWIFDYDSEDLNGLDREHSKDKIWECLEFIFGMWNLLTIC